MFPCVTIAKTVRIIAEADSTPGSSDNTRNEGGCIMTFGQGDCGQLGLGDAMTERKKPFPVAGQLEGHKIIQIECGGMHTVALTDDGKVSNEECCECHPSIYSLLFVSKHQKPGGGILASPYFSS